MRPLGASRILLRYLRGGVAEWFKAAVLKTAQTRNHSQWGRAPKALRQRILAELAGRRTTRALPAKWTRDDTPRREMALIR